MCNVSRMKTEIGIRIKSMVAIKFNNLLFGVGFLFHFFYDAAVITRNLMRKIALLIEFPTNRKASPVVKYISMQSKPMRELINLLLIRNVFYMFIIKHLHYLNEF